MKRRRGGYKSLLPLAAAAFVTAAGLWLFQLIVYFYDYHRPPSELSALLEKGCRRYPTQIVYMKTSSGHAGRLKCAEAVEAARSGDVTFTTVLLLETRAPTVIFETSIRCQYKTADESSSGKITCQIATDAL